MLSAGTRLGPYEILAPLGAGGMGEVYKARDIRLDRFVAIKVLPEEFARHEDRLRRFEKEARAASALNHPHILAVYDVGSEASGSYIVTELVEGRTLRDMLLRGRLSFEKLLGIATQIADGLAAAHEAGIVHRDLKPSNIMISREGFAKILDFGLSKVPPSLTPAESDVSTESVSLTAPGALVGTAGYMSPEAVSGKPVDYRSDQFALGAVLYEMVTGSRAFGGTTTVETLAAVARADYAPIPRENCPPPLIWIVERCLMKDPSDRYISTRDLFRDLKALGTHLGDLAAKPSRDIRAASVSRVLLGAGVLGVIVLGVVIWSGSAGRRAFRARPGRPLSATSLLITAPENTTFNFFGTSPAPMALSPDGRRIAFGATDPKGRNLLWIRELRDLTARPLAGTEDATYPFWSPDSRSLAFFSNGKLRRIDSAGGPVQVICTARDGRGGDWGLNGRILFAPDTEGPLFTVDSNGMNLRQVTQEKLARTDFNHRWPNLLPDGDHFLYMARFSDDRLGATGIYVGSLKSPWKERLLPDLSNAVFADPGYLLFTRRNSLMVVGFDPRSLRLMGEPIAIVDQIGYHGYRWSGSFTVSRTGTLAFLAGNRAYAQLRWFSRDGRLLGSVGEDADYEGLRLSPSGDRCAVEIRQPRTADVDIWILDLARGVAERLTSVGGNIAPVWSPDGGRIVFASDRDGHWNLFTRSASGEEPERLLARSEGDDSPTDWSRDGRLLLFDHLGSAPHHQLEIWSYTFAGKEMACLIRSEANDQDGVLSPDGRYLAFTSGETGTPQVYVRPVASFRGRLRISPDKGSRPLWRQDGKELFYLSGNTLMATSLTLRDGIELGGTRTLFSVPLRESASNMPPYCPNSDGSRFLLVTNPSNLPITVIPDWIAAMHAD